MTKIWDSGAYAEGTLLVLLALADWANDEGLSIFPSIEAIGEKARLSTRQVQRALGTLRDDGVLEPIKNSAGGRGRRVEYRLHAERVTKRHPLPKGDMDDAKGRHLEHERVTSESERVTSATSHIDNHHLEPSENHHDSPGLFKEVPLEEPKKLKRGEEPPDFSAWYAAYPRHEARGAAARAYAAARQHATAQELLEGAERYATGRKGEDARFTKHPATWLNGKCWLDEASGAPAQAASLSREKRLFWLEKYAIDGRWPPNRSGNGHWDDGEGIGPPPHISETLVTESDFALIRGAGEMAEKKKLETRR